MAWYLAPSLVALRSEANTVAPNRSKASDGTIGDPAHASRTSDHNPKPDGRGGMVVDALDLTHDPGAGFDVHARLRTVAKVGDERVKYLISAGQIWNPTSTAWATYRRLRDEGHSRLEAARMTLPGWRTYTGANPHDRHGHISVKATATARGEVSSWFAIETSKPVIPAEEDDMFIAGDGKSAWLIIGNHRHWVSSPAELERLKAAGVKYVEAPNLVRQVPVGEGGGPEVPTP